jgi:hypothetical protein
MGHQFENSPRQSLRRLCQRSAVPIGSVWTATELMLRFEVITAVTMKNAVVWDVTLCVYCKNRRFGAT